MLQRKAERRERAAMKKAAERRVEVNQSPEEDLGVHPWIGRLRKFLTLHETN